MNKTAQKRKRRGVILSSLGLQRLQDAQEQLAITGNGGYAYTLEQLSHLTGLSIRSITRLQSCKVAVDRRTLEDFFCAFNLVLTAQDYIQPEAGLEQQIPIGSIAQDWGEALDVSYFYGRIAELSMLTQWVVQDHCRLLGIFGIGGIGKTALSVKLAEQVKDQFTCVIWRSLRNAPPLETLLAELVPFLSAQQETKATLSNLLQCLRNQRCLVVLDNLETLLQSGHTGQYRPGYEAYGELFQVIAETPHQSCMVLTSREKLAEIARCEGIASAVRTLTLNGSPEAAAALVEATGLTGSESQKRELCDRYRCNPLALKIVATSIHDLFDGAIELFLQQDTLVFNGLHQLLDQQFQRLSDLEQMILYWLAINREWTTIAELEKDIIPAVSRTKLLEVLESLSWRSLIERKSGCYTQQPVVMEYVTNRLGEEITIELLTKQLHFFRKFALTKTTVKDYIRVSQERLILGMIGDRLRTEFNFTETLKQYMQELLQLLHRIGSFQDYAGGNLINLCRYLNLDLTGYDFSDLAIWHGHLQQINLHQVSFHNADLSQSIFIQTLESALSIAFSPDGECLATADTNGQVYLWNVAKGQPLLTLEGHRNWVWSVAFNPDGKTLASCSEDQTIRLWDRFTGVCLHVLQAHTDWIWAVNFSPDGKRLASCSDDRTVRLWDVATGQLLHTLQGHKSRVCCVRFSPDGQLLASGGEDQTIRLWTVNTGQCLTILRGHTQSVTSVDFSPEGHMLASGSHDQTIQLWSIPSGQRLHSLQGHTNRVLSVAFAPQHLTKILAKTLTKTLAKTPEGTGTETLTGTSTETSQAHDILASSSEDQTIRLWHSGTGRLLRILSGHTKPVTSLAFSPDQQLLASSSYDQTVRLWDVATGQAIKSLRGYTGGVQAIAFVPIASQAGLCLASGGHDPVVRLWQVETGSLLQTFSGHTDWVRGIAASPEGKRLATGGHDQTVRLWDVTTGKLLYRLQRHTDRVRAVAFSPDGRLVASSGEDELICLWDATTGRLLQVLRGHQGDIMTVTFAPSGCTDRLDQQILASGSDDATIRLWDAATGKLLKVLEGHTGWIWSLTFMPRSNQRTVLVSSSEDQTVRFWDITTGQTLTLLKGHVGSISSLAANATGQLLATGSYDQTIKLWDVTTGQLLRTLQGHTGWVQSIAFSPPKIDGKTNRLEPNPIDPLSSNQILASGSTDETIKLWDIHTGKCLKTLRADRPYEGMNITGVKGITEAQKATLQALGAYACGV